MIDVIVSENQGGQGWARLQDWGQPLRQNNQAWKGEKGCSGIRDCFDRQALPPSLSPSTKQSRKRREALGWLLLA